MKLTAVAFVTALMLPAQHTPKFEPCVGDCRSVSREQIIRLVDKAYAAGQASGREDCLRPASRSL